MILPPAGSLRFRGPGGKRAAPIDLSNYQGQIGDIIGIRVNDDFDVATVNVKIMTTGGSLVEHGSAVKPVTDGLRWFYTATAEIPDGERVNVEVTATDRETKG